MPESPPSLGTAAAAFIALTMLMLVTLSLPSGAFVVVIGDPRGTPQRTLDIIGEAGGRFVSAGFAPWVAVAYSETAGFPARLYRAGALAVLNHAIAVGCIERNSS